MKRILALLLVCVVLANMGAVASAEDYDLGGDPASSEVTVTTYAAKLPDEKTYYVTVTIPSALYCSFTYADLEWNPSTHTYGDSGDTAGTWEWDGDAPEITVTNYSDAAVEVSLSFKPVTGYAGIDMKFENSIDSNGGSTTLDSAANESNPTEAGEATSVKFSMEMTGSPNVELASETQIGTVTVTLEGVY